MWQWHHLCVARWANRFPEGEPWLWISICRSSTQVRPNLELRRGDVVAGPIDPGDFDLVTARAVLHHVADAQAAVANLVASVRPGGAILLIEPDFLPVSVAEPLEVRAFWEGWLTWSRRAGNRLRNRPATPGDPGNARPGGHRGNGRDRALQRRL